ncbi:MAG: hypothetical protein AAF215_27600 [Cyanobacteria bacterium P01_A01_bin.123]
MKRLFFLLTSTCLITPLLTAATTASAKTQLLNTNLAHTGDVVSGLLQPVFPIVIDSNIITYNGDSLTGQGSSSFSKARLATDSDIITVNGASLTGQRSSPSPKGLSLNGISLEGQTESKGLRFQGTALDGQTESKGFTLNSTSLDGQRIEPKGARIQGTALDGQTEFNGFTINSTSLDGQSAIAQ